MEKYQMNNGINVVYEKIKGDITSFSVAFDAGAIREVKDELGLSHVVEHMIFKGTNTKNEAEINKLCDEYFGFNNAMTNYPYVVYYGTCLSEDFYKACSLYGDIIKNPTFKIEGFKEEIDVICQELREWRDDISQFCEDELFFNSFENRRIKDLIIGTEKSVRSFKREDVVRFYKDYYKPKNCVISVVSSLGLNKVKDMLEDIFSMWTCSDEICINPLTNLYEENRLGSFVKLKKDIETARIQYIFPIHELNEKEVQALRIFNAYFGEGTSSLLYDKVRTQNGLAYEIASNIKNESGIKLFTIYAGTSKDKITETIRLINEQICEIKKSKGVFTKNKINKLSKSIKLKRSLALEKSIRLSLNLAVYGIMYKDAESLYKQIDGIEEVDESLIIDTINKVLNNPSIQVIEPSL
ncbi:M16 family metallopeptidase [Haloimpatiens sp. FM7315]|uniref:M16 family metallopeptidase n=1 Tax=Haloimpatiens sp. FM7315 TaxID=3298609 RepID=UPI00370C91B7